MRTAPSLLALALLCAGTPSHAAPVDAWTLSASYGTMVSTQWSVGLDSGRTAVQVTGMRGNLGAGAGIALLHSGALRRSTAFEGFAQARLAAPFRLSPRSATVMGWRPAVGIEVGLSGAQSFSFEVSEGSPARTSPLYVSTFAEPLRFHVGPVMASAFEIGFGSTLPAYGRVLRLRLTFLRVGVWLDP